MADVTDPNSWTDVIASTPPTNWQSDSGPATYEYSLNSGGSAPYAPIHFTGSSSFLNGTFNIDWTYFYEPGISDPGLNINVSFDGGSSWTNNTLVTSGQAQTVSGTLSLPIPGGASGIKVDVGIEGWVG